MASMDLSHPAFGQPIISNHIGSDLIGRQVLQPNRRDLGDAEELRCRDPAMTRDDRVHLVQQDGVGETEGFNAVGDLPSLSFGMSTGIARIVL